jgi:hypothetical protein
MSERYFSCLLIGPPGAGKTTMAMTAPKPVLFLDIDNKLHKMVNAEVGIKSGEVIQWAINEPLTEVSLTRMASFDPAPAAKVTVPRPKGYIQLAEMIDKLVESGCMVNGKKIATIVLDSYTSMNEHLKRLLMAANGTSTMTLPLYGTALTNFETLNNTLLRLPANIIFICHEQIDKDELSGKISYHPLIDGQMKDKIGKDFEEVYYLEKVITGDKVRFEALTLGNSMKSCRTSRILPAKVEPNFTTIYGGK